MFEGIDNEAKARRALEEIERLMRAAAADGVVLDSWIAEAAAELRAAWPEIDAAGAAEVARRVAAKPQLSMAAQARIRGAALRALRG